MGSQRKGARNSCYSMWSSTGDNKVAMDAARAGKLVDRVIFQKRIMTDIFRAYKKSEALQLRNPSNPSVALSTEPIAAYELRRETESTG